MAIWEFRNFDGVLSRIHFYRCFKKNAVLGTGATIFPSVLTVILLLKLRSISKCRLLYYQVLVSVRLIRSLYGARASSHRLLAVSIGRLLTCIDYCTIDVRSHIASQYFSASKSIAPEFEPTTSRYFVLESST